MSVQLLCPNLKCRKILTVPEETRGKIVKCKSCMTMLRVPPSKNDPQPDPVATDKSHK